MTEDEKKTKAAKAASRLKKAIQKKLDEICLLVGKESGPIADYCGRDGVDSILCAVGCMRDQVDGAI